jgi:hypothetical protein
MADTLTATASSLANVRPVTDEAGVISSMEIDVNLSYTDSSGGDPIGRMVTFDIWPLLTGTQQTALQDVQAAIQAYITATYFS